MWVEFSRGHINACQRLIGIIFHNLLLSRTFIPCIRVLYPMLFWFSWRVLSVWPPNSFSLHFHRPSKIKTWYQRDGGSPTTQVKYKKEERGHTFFTRSNTSTFKVKLPPPPVPCICFLLNHTYSWRLMFVDCQNFAGSWGRYFVCKCYEALQCFTLLL